MICPKCGAEIPDNANRCSSCGIKVNVRCPQCNTINPFGAKICKSCGFQLLITCPVCGSINAYSASECRKCHSQLSKNYLEQNNINKTFSKIDKVNEGIEVVDAFSSAAASVKQLIGADNNKSIIISEPEDGGLPFVNNINDEFVPDKIFNVQQDNNYVESDELDLRLNSDKENSDDLLLEEFEAEISDIEEPVEQQSSSAVEVVIDSDDLSKNDLNSKSLENNTDIPLSDENENSVTVKEVNEDTVSFDETIDVEISDKKEQEDDNKNEDETERQDIVHNTVLLDIQREVVEKTVNLLTSSLKKHIIAINGAEGSGKTAVIHQVTSCLSQQGFISLSGSCTPLVQITGFGFFQDAFLRMMGFPPFTNNFEAFSKEFKKTEFAQIFNSLKPFELNLFLNMLYPTQTDNFENILSNKDKMFEVLEKVIKSFLVNHNLIISIDNFELLDGASYDFIMNMIKKGYFNDRLKLLIAYQENKSIQSYFDLNAQEEKIFETILLKKLSRDEIIKTVNLTLSCNIEDILDKQMLDELIYKSDGNAIRLEQEIALLFDLGYILVDDEKIYINKDNKPDITPVKFEELIKLRLNALTPASKNILYMAAIMGYRFAVNILCSSASVNSDKSDNILNYLIQQLFIRKVDDYTFEFRNLTIWKMIYQEAKQDLLYKENSEKLYDTLKRLVLSGNIQKVVSCSEALSKQESFIIWQETAALSAKLGDTNLYIIAKKQCLKILEEKELENSDKIKSQIYEEIGKLLYIKSPKEAISYLSNVLDVMIKDNDIKKTIDLSGYFVKSCYLSGNYFGAVEAVDAVIKQLDGESNTNDADIALIKTRKLRALLNIGNSEQIINLVNEDIIPVLNRTLESDISDLAYKKLIINGILTAEISLAKAYAMQGNNSVFEVIEDVKQMLNLYQVNSDYYSVQLDIIDAFAHTVTGEVNKSNDILNNIADAYKSRVMEKNLLSEWNLINIINRVLLNQDEDLKIDLFELAAFTNNINEHFIKNIVKLILGYVLEKEGDSIKALEIYNEEITYFAKEKVAIGALFSWALLVNYYIKSQETDKALNTALKSLDIAKSAKINNFIFIICFKRLIAKLYIEQGDLEAAKMYLEEAMVLAKQFGLKYQLTELYIDYAGYIEALMKSKRIYSSENVSKTTALYKKAVLTAKELEIPVLTEKAQRAKAGFMTFCQLNSIEV